MDKIWYRNPSKSEVIGCCGGMKKPNDHAEPTNSRTLRKEIVYLSSCLLGEFFISV